MDNEQVGIAIVLVIGILSGVAIADLINLDLANQRGSDWTIYKTELCKELGGSPVKEQGYCNLNGNQILYANLQDAVQPKERT